MDKELIQLCDEYGWDVVEQEDGPVEVICRAIPDIVITVDSDDFVANVEAACDSFTPSKAIYDTLKNIDNVEEVPDINVLMDICEGFEAELCTLVAGLREATLGRNALGVNLDIGNKSDPYLLVSDIDEDKDVELYFGVTGPGFFSALKVATVAFKAIGNYVEEYAELPVRLTIMPSALMNAGICGDEDEANEILSDAYPFLAGMQARYEDLFSELLVCEPLFMRISLTADGCCLTLNEDATWPPILQFFAQLPDMYYKFSAESSGLALLVQSAFVRSGMDLASIADPGTLTSYMPTAKQAKTWLALDTYCDDPISALEHILRVGIMDVMNNIGMMDWEEEDEEEEEEDWESDEE